MKKLSLACLVPAFAASLLAQPPASTVRAGTAVISGENPYMRLLDKEGGKVVTQVSFWRVYWSPAGPGTVCYVTVGEQGQPDAKRIALYDNEKLYDYLTNQVMGVRTKAYIDWPFEKVGKAKFKETGDSIHERTESCLGGKYKIVLGWHDLADPQLVDYAPGSQPGNPFGLTFFNLIAKSADVTINGKKAPGTTFGGSAAVFGESWLKK